MKKIRFTVLLSLLFFLCFWQSKDVQAEISNSGKCGDNVRYTYDSNTRILTLSGNGATYDYDMFGGEGYHPSPFNSADISEVIIENGVTTIGKCLFYYAYIEKIKLPDSLTSIGDYAFENCFNLKKIKIPDRVTTIGKNAFYDIYALTDVIIGNGVTKIGHNAFTDCESLKNVKFGNHIKYIESYAFSYCHSLKSVTLSDSVIDIYSNAFECCSKLKTVTLGKGLKTIGSSAFSECHALESIIIPDSVTTLGDNAFYKCKKMTKATIGNGVTRISSSAFEQCTSLKDAKIGNHVKTIDWFAFYKCGSLKNVTIPSSVIKIVDYAFCGCKSFTNITIPSSVKNIGVDAFSSCYRLAKITIKGKKTTLKKGFIGYKSWGSTITTTTNPVVVIYGYKDSTAQKYANQYKLGFQTIGQKQAAKSAITSLASGKGELQLQAKWKKVAKAYQYEIQIYSSPDKYGYSRYVRLITENTSLKFKQNKNLKKGKTYSVRVRAYAKNGGKQIVSPWSGVKKIKIKK